MTDKAINQRFLKFRKLGYLKQPAAVLFTERIEWIVFVKNQAGYYPE